MATIVLAVLLVSSLSFSWGSARERISLPWLPGLPGYQPTGTGTITGHVADHTGPLEGVTVALSGTDLITTTSADGSFSLGRVPMGVWTVVLSRHDDSGRLSGDLCWGLIPNLKLTEAGQVLAVPGTYRPAYCNPGIAQ